MSTGLLASTVTPGNTAPLVSRTVPVILLCAEATFGRRTKSSSAKKLAHTKVAGLILDFIDFPPVSSFISRSSPPTPAGQMGYHTDRELSSTVPTNAVCDANCAAAGIAHDRRANAHSVRRILIAPSSGRHENA